MPTTKNTGPSGYECPDCDWTGYPDHMAPIDDCEDRVSMGEFMAAGQCPDCGSLIGVNDADVPDYTIQTALEIATERWGDNPQTLLLQALDYEREAFEKDTEIDGSDMVEWFSKWRASVRDLLERKA